MIFARSRSKRLGVTIVEEHRVDVERTCRSSGATSVIDPKADLWSLESDLAPTLQVALHWAWCVGHILLDPGERNIGLKVCQPFEFPLCLVETPGLGQSSYQQSAGPIEGRPEPQNTKCAIDGFIIATSEIVRRCQPAMENHLLWIVRAHANCGLRVN